MVLHRIPMAGPGQRMLIYTGPTRARASSGTLEIGRTRASWLIICGFTLGQRAGDGFVDRDRRRELRPKVLIHLMNGAAGSVTVPTGDRIDEDDGNTVRLTHVNRPCSAIGFRCAGKSSASDVDRRKRSCLDLATCIWFDHTVMDKLHETRE